MRARPSTERGKVLLEVGQRDSRLLAKETGELRLKKILVPIDFSECSQKALQYAVALARQFQADLLCLHVVEIPYGFGGGEAGVVVEMERFRKNQHAESQRALADMVRAEAGDVTTKPLLRSGVPYYEIARAAAELDADLIVISTHGRTGLGRLFLGSTTERVVRHATCPVLVVREHEHDFIEPRPRVAQPKRKRRTSR